MLKKLILKLFVVVLPVIALFFVHMYMIVSFAEKLSDNMVNGKLSYVLPNYNGRRVERKIIEKQMKVPETLFLGTSPILELGPEVTGYDDQLVLCPGTGFFVDWLGILGLYKKQGRGFPKRVVWEPTAIAIVRKGSLGYLAHGHIFKDTYAYFYDMQGIEKWRWYLEQIIGTVKESCQFTNLFQGTYAYKIYERKEDAFHPELITTVFPDGHSRRSSSYDEHIFIPAAPGSSDLYYDPDYYPEKMSQYFNDLKGFCTANGIEFVVLLPPVSPSFISDYNTTHASDNLSVESVENYIRQLAGDCLVRGSFSPYDLNLTNADFIDEAHVRRDKLKQMWDYIK